MAYIYLINEYFIMTEGKAYILLSGGQDSFVSLLWAMHNFRETEAVSLHYSQSHKKELKYASHIAKQFKLAHTVYDIGNFFNITTISSLLVNGDHNELHQLAKHLPASFVPNRNGIFLTVAANHAYKKGEKHLHLVIGACETDFSGYPDCRNSYIQAKQLELSLGLDRPVSIHTPLMWKSKAQIFEMAEKFGKLKELVKLTLTCYNGIETLNDWGRGCKECPACMLRIKGYEEFKNKMQITND
jgi:7-cyano-7-deazaguanine synthase